MIKFAYLFLYLFLDEGTVQLAWCCKTDRDCLWPCFEMLKSKSHKTTLTVSFHLDVLRLQKHFRGDFRVANCLICLSQIPLMWSLGRKAFLLGYDHWFSILASVATVAGCKAFPLVLRNSISIYFPCSNPFFHCTSACRGYRRGAWLCFIPWPRCWNLTRQ